MQSQEILKIYGTDYKEMTKKLLREADLKGEIPSSDTKIGIKPNLVSPTAASYGATTHPEIVEGIVEYLKGEGFFDLRILEGSWWATKPVKRLKSADIRNYQRDTASPWWIPRKTAPCSRTVRECS